MSGNIVLTAGQLTATNAGALGDTTKIRQVVVGAASTFNVSGGQTFDSNLGLNLTGTGFVKTDADLTYPGALNSLSGNNIFAGPVTVATSTIKSSNAGDKLTLSGDVVASAAAAQTLTLVGRGDIELSGAQNLALGGLTLNGPGTITLSGSGNNTGTVLVNSGTLILNKSGTANAVGLNYNTTGTGGGTLTIGDGLGLDTVRYAASTGTDQINDQVTVTLGTSGVLDLNGNSDTIGALAAAAISNNTSTTVNLIGSPVPLLSSGIPTGVGLVKLGGGTLTVGFNHTNTTFGGIITQSGNLVKVGGGTLTLANQNSYVGNTTLTTGSIALGINDALPTSTNLTITSPTANAFNLAGWNQTVANLSSSGQIALGNTGATLTFGTATDETLSATISGNVIGTAGGLRKLGTSTYTLSGLNTFTTNLFIDNGTIKALDLGATLGNTAPVWLNTTNGVTLDLRSNVTQVFGNVDTVNVTGSGTATINVQNDGVGLGNVLSLGVLNIGSAGGQTLHITGANGYWLRFTGATTLTPDTTTTLNVDSGLNLEIAGIIGVTSGSLIKSGGGLLVLSGANTQTGNITLNAGTLRALGSNANAAQLGGSLSPNGVVLNGGTLDLRANAFAITNFARNFTVAGNAAINSDVLTGLSGFSTSVAQPIAPTVFNTFTNLQIGANTLSVTGTTGVGVQSLGLTTLTGNATFSVDPGQFLQLNQVAGGALGFTKIGAGILNIAGPNGLSGTTLVSGGILRASNVLALGTMTTTVGGATPGTLEVNNALLTSGQIVLDNGGTLRGVGAGAGFSGLGNPLSVDRRPDGQPPNGDQHLRFAGLQYGRCLRHRHDELRWFWDWGRRAADAGRPDGRRCRHDHQRWRPGAHHSRVQYFGHHGRLECDRRHSATRRHDERDPECLGQRGRCRDGQWHGDERRHPRDRPDRDDDRQPDRPDRWRARGFGRHGSHYDLQQQHHPDECGGWLGFDDRAR